MKRKAGEGIDDQTLTQTFPSKRTHTDGKEVNFSTLTFPQRLWHIVENETYKSIGWHQWGTCVATPSASKTSLDLGFSQDTSSDAPPMTSSVDSSLDSTLLSLLAKITDLAQTTSTDLHLKAAQLQSTLAALIPSMSPSVLADLSSLVSRALAQPCPKGGHNPLCSEDSEKAGC
ncbi:hypothetical protein SRHO_G00235750 [Serrasalmus rhombeus]